MDMTMKELKVKEYANELIRNEIRKGKLYKGKDILEILPELLATVEVDKKKLKKDVEKCLDSKNPLNAILSLFGIQIIQKEKALKVLMRENVDDLEEEQVVYAKNWLAINPEEMEHVVAKIAEKLHEMEQESSLNVEEEKNRGDVLFKKHEKLKMDYTQLKNDKEITEKMVSEKVQYMLSVSGQTAIGENEPLIELLRDMDIEVYWDSKDTEFADAAMFTEYKVDGTAFHTKPCLIRNGEIYIKGTRFVTI